MCACTRVHLYVDGTIRLQNKLVHFSALEISALTTKCADKYLIKLPVYSRADVKDERKRADALVLCEENGRSEGARLREIFRDNVENNSGFRKRDKSPECVRTSTDNLFVALFARRLTIVTCTTRVNSFVNEWACTL